MGKDAVTRKALLLPAELAREIDDFRFENRFRTDAEALRVLIEAGLKATKAKIAPVRAGA